MDSIVQILFKCIFQCILMKTTVIMNIFQQLHEPTGDQMLTGCRSYNKNQRCDLSRSEAMLQDSTRSAEIRRDSPKFTEWVNSPISSNSDIYLTRSFEIRWDLTMSAGILRDPMRSGEVCRDPRDPMRSTRSAGILRESMRSDEICWDPSRSDEIRRDVASDSDSERNDSYRSHSRTLPTL